MGKRSGIHKDPLLLAESLMNFINQRAFMIGLKAFQLYIQLYSELSKIILYGLQ
ncbi:hypothetical protein D3C86_2229710 [compost metagenome]